MHDGGKTMVSRIESWLATCSPDHRAMQFNNQIAAKIEDNLLTWTKNNNQPSGMDNHLRYLLDSILIHSTSAINAHNRLCKIKRFNANTWPDAQVEFGLATTSSFFAFDLLGHMLSIAKGNDLKGKTFSSVNCDYERSNKSNPNSDAKYEDRYYLSKNKPITLTFQSSINTQDKIDLALNYVGRYFRNKPVHRTYNYVVARRYPRSNSAFMWVLYDPRHSLGTHMDDRRCKANGTDFTKVPVEQFFPKDKTFLIPALDIIESLIYTSVKELNGVSEEFKN